ncbi:MAG: hypothetical protein FWC61_00550 [Proteobacteria bacterium]|nr:hypothetical protein [Pseudomonadota bacterium]
MSKKIWDIIRWILVPVVFFAVFFGIFVILYKSLLGFGFSQCTCTEIWPDNSCSCMPGFIQKILMLVIPAAGAALVAPKYKIIAGVSMVVIAVLWVWGLSGMAG